MINVKEESWPAPMEFELAYQARVAIDRIRFAIKHTEQFAPQTNEMREVSLQLLDAVDRLESAERNFQLQFRIVRRFGSRSPDQPVKGRPPLATGGGSI
jgi:hypothetical protein